MTETMVPWYRLRELDEIADGPGLYAWYAVPVAGPPDWQTPQLLGQLLAQHTRCLEHPHLELEVNWHLGAMWSGTLPEGGIPGLATLIEELADGTRASPAKELGLALGNATHRELLVDVLVRAAPRLTPPLYVGISKGLRGRLQSHRRAYDAAQEAFDDGKDPIEAIGNKLGARLVKARIPEEALRVSVLEITSLNEITDAEYRRIAAAAEYILNRWQHPIFGER